MHEHHCTFPVSLLYANTRQGTKCHSILQSTHKAKDILTGTFNSQSTCSVAAAACTEDCLLRLDKLCCLQKYATLVAFCDVVCLDIPSCPGNSRVITRYPEYDYWPRHADLKAETEACRRPIGPLHARDRMIEDEDPESMMVQLR